MGKKKRAETKKEAIRESESEGKRQETKSYHLISISLILLISIAIYSNTLKNGFVYDDEFTIVNNTLIKNFSNISKLFTKEYFSTSGEMSYRPVVTFTYFLDYALYGIKPWGYHLTNLLLHAMNGVILYIFLTLLFKPSQSSIPVLKHNGTGFNLQSSIVNLQLLISLLFISHPVLTEAVNAISFREDLLVVFFLLPSFILFIRLFEDVRLGYTRRLFYSLSLVLYAIALFSKEMAITYPLLLIGYIYLTTSPSPPSEEGKGGFKGGNIRRDHIIFLIIGYMVVTLIYLLIYYGLLKNSNPAEFPYDIPDLATRLLTLPTVIVRYFLLFIFPYNLNADYIIDFNRSLTEPSFLFSLTIIAVIGAAIFYLVRKDRMSIYGLFWFFISLLPVMNIIPIVYVIAERYLYLPFIGLSLFASIYLITIYKWLPNTIKIAGVSAIVVIILLLSIRTVYRNMDWKDEMILWSKTVVASPNSSKAYYNLGIGYERQGDLDAAIKEYKTAIKLRSNHPDAHNNLGIGYERQGDFDAAIKEYKTAIKLKSDHPLTHYNLGNVYNKRGQLDDAIKEYNTAIKLRPNNPNTHYNLGNVYFKQGQLDEAVREYLIVLKLKPDFVAAHNNLGDLYFKQGQLDEAIREYLIVLKLSPDDTKGYFNLGNAYFKQGQLDEAIREYLTVLRLKPDYPEAHYNLAGAYSMKGLNGRAIVELEFALRLKPDYLPARQALESMRRR